MQVEDKVPKHSHLNSSADHKGIRLCTWKHRSVFLEVHLQRESKQTGKSNRKSIPKEGSDIWLTMDKCDLKHQNYFSALLGAVWQHHHSYSLPLCPFLKHWILSHKWAMFSTITLQTRQCFYGFCPVWRWTTTPFSRLLQLLSTALSTGCLCATCGILFAEQKVLFSSYITPSWVVATRLVFFFQQ